LSAIGHPLRQCRGGLGGCPNRRRGWMSKSASTSRVPRPAWMDVQITAKWMSNAASGPGGCPDDLSGGCPHNPDDPVPLDWTSTSVAWMDVQITRDMDVQLRATPRGGG